MRYSSEENKILISCREFVKIARRAISPIAPRDEDEPEDVRISKRSAARILGECEPYEASLDFECAGFGFALTAKIEKVKECNLWFAKCISGDPRKPKKPYREELRGEAYISAYVYATREKLTRVKLNYVYISTDRGDYAEGCEWADTKKLESFFNRCKATVGIYARPEVERVTERLPSMRGLKFPYSSVREGQREFVRSAYRNIARGGTLYAIAPTGTGKTVSAIYPAVRAMGEGLRDKTFYLTPKETTAKAAIDCLGLMREHGAVIRAIKLTAKEKQCRSHLICRDDRALCKNSKCNKIADAVLALYSLGLTVVTEKEIGDISREYTVCPYELSLAYSELCDVVICDFNYLFDTSAYIRRFFTEGGNYIFLIDEAHNLPDRAREMYSAEISDRELSAPSEREMIGEHSKFRTAAIKASNLLYTLLFEYVKEDIRKDGEEKRAGAAHLKEVPDGLYSIFGELISAAEAELLACYSAVDGEAKTRTKIIRDYLAKIKKFNTVLEKYDSSYETFIFFEEDTIRIKLFCIDTSRRIAERLDKGRAAVFFSATLTPLYYYKSLLGADGASDTLEVESPFETDQLTVAIMDKISTRYSEREDTLTAVCRAIAATVSAKRGNYMIFSPSFAYSEALSKAFAAKYPKIKTLVQRKGMTRDERESFLAEFSKESDSYLIGFCVLGGIYAEGIDLSGDSLIGAVVVGIGMPTLSYEREAICAYYDEKYEEGKQFSYIYPGMNRVLQAAGRVIRTEDDRGVIVLIDDRFDDPIYKKIVPKLWNGMKYIGDPKELRTHLDEFWEGK